MVQGCFSTPGSPVYSKGNTCNNNISKENIVTCVYLTQLFNSSPIYVTLTWSKTSHSHTLTLHSTGLFSHTMSLYPSTFSLFRTRAGSKSIPLTQQINSRDKIKLYWDFTQAKFTHPNSAEPESGFYLGLVSRVGRVEFFLGDQHDELSRRLGGVTNRVNSAESTTTTATLLCRREHVFDRKHYSTRAEFLGSTHLIEIECSSGALKVKFNGVNKLTVKRLGWKFRGSEKIFIDGITVEFSWDVFNWINKNTNSNNNINNSGVFVFKVGGGGVWPEMVGPEKKLMKKSSSLPAVSAAVSPAGSNASSVLQWAEESDCGGSLSSASSRSSGGSCGGGGDATGFSLVLYAWRR